MASCVNDLKDIEAIDRKVDNIDRFTEIKMTYSDSANVRVSISGDVMETHYAQNKHAEDYFPNGIFVEFYNDFGKANSWLSAKKARRYPTKNLVVVRDSVVLFNIEGDTLRTDELFWDNKEGQIYTERVFRYSKGNGERIFGRKFRSDQSFKEYTFEKMTGNIQQNVPG